MKAIIKFCLTTLLAVIIVIFIQRVLEQQSVPKKLLDSNIIQQVLEKLPFLVKKNAEKTVNDQNSSPNKTETPDVRMNIDEKEPEQLASGGKNANEPLVILIENVEALRERIKKGQIVLIAKEQDKTFVLDASETVKALSNDVTRNTKVSSYFVKSNLVEYYKDDFLLKGINDMAKVRVYMTTDLINRTPDNIKKITLPFL
jgi:hypothetical protein